MDWLEVRLKAGSVDSMAVTELQAQINVALDHRNVSGIDRKRDWF